MKILEKSFIMIKTETSGGVSGIRWVQGEIEKYSEVIEAHKTLGPFDVIAVAETENKDELTMLIDKIRTMDGVKDTDTYITY